MTSIGTPRNDQGLMRPGPAPRNPILPEEVHPVRPIPSVPPYRSDQTMLEDEERPVSMGIDTVEPTAVSNNNAGTPSRYGSIRV